MLLQQHRDGPVKPVDAIRTKLRTEIVQFAEQAILVRVPYYFYVGSRRKRSFFDPSKFKTKGKGPADEREDRDINRAASLPFVSVSLSLQRP
jgi:hypothetical protein